MSVITSLTAQNTREVTAIHPVPPEFVAAQMDAVFSDIGAEAVKIGNAPQRRNHRNRGGKACILRSAFSRTGPGDDFHRRESASRKLRRGKIAAKTSSPGQRSLRQNLPEALTLLERNSLSLKDPSEEERKEICRGLANLGARGILLKGGHGSGEKSDDLLYCTKSGRVSTFRSTSPKHPPTLTARDVPSPPLWQHTSPEGFLWKRAVGKAKKYITRALEAGKDYTFGKRTRTGAFFLRYLERLIFPFHKKTHSEKSFLKQIGFSSSKKAKKHAPHYGKQRAFSPYRIWFSQSSAGFLQYGRFWKPRAPPMPLKGLSLRKYRLS